MADHAFPGGLQVAVPSHARADVVNAKTLRLLADRGVPAEVVRVFVAPGELGHYRSVVDPGLCAEVVPGMPGLAAQRNLISASYPEGTQLVQLDDDLDDVRQRTGDKDHVPVPDLQVLFRLAFGWCQAAGPDVGLWGVYPVLNPMFMQPRVVAGLYFCLGQLWGMYNTHAPHAQVLLDQKEDYERTLRWYVATGAVVRLDYVATKSRMYAAGGMQADDQPDRRQLNHRAVHHLVTEYPGLVRVAKRRSKQVGLELALRPQRATMRVLVDGA